MKKGFYLEIDEPDLDEYLQKELCVAENIFSRCQKSFNIPYVKTEINRLAVYLKGKSDYVDSSYITAEIDEFVLETLNLIKEKFAIDFIDNVQLRMSLCLHLMPLLIRLKYNMQMKNVMLEDIRNTYQFAFDIAYLFAYQIQKKFDFKITEDEISYFAIYFNSALNIYNQSKGTNRMLIISSLKRSETLLLRERINSWFIDSVSELSIVNRYEISEIDMGKYNIICTTDKNEYYDDGTAMLISKFPSKKDYRILKMLLDGFNSKDDFLKIFHSDLFISVNGGGKYRLIDILCDLITLKEECNIKDSLHEREKMGGTYFGNGVAMPHPIHPITDNSYIAVAVLKNSVKWDEYNNQVKLIFLVSIKKDNPQAFKIWSYLSEMIKDEALIDVIISNPTYDNLIRHLSLWLDSSKQLWDINANIL